MSGKDKKMKITQQQLDLVNDRIRALIEADSFYGKKLAEAGITHINSPEEFTKLPFSEKKDLRDAYPLGLMTAPEEKIVRIHSSSGTTGTPVIIPYTAKDVDDWGEMFKRCYEVAGITNMDRIQITPGYGLWTAGIGFQNGCEKLGAMAVPMGPGNTEKQLEMMQALKSTVLCSTSSYALLLAEEIEKRGIKDKIYLKKGVIGSERWSDKMRKHISESLGIELYDIYGLTELSGPGVAYECEAQSGMHINEDHFIAEIIDPETGEVLPYGEKGELVFTSITKEAFPLIRYRTKDICILHEEECACGRTFLKMCKPMGRSDDMLIVKGVNVFPSQIEMVLLAEGLTSNYQIIVDRIGTTDSLEVKVEITPELFTDTMGALTTKELKITEALKTMLGIQAKVSIVEPKSIVRSEGKAVRVIDKRKLY